MNEFGELIIALDTLLTGKKLEECRKNFEIKSAPWTDPAYWLWERTDIYYLSDGGYSRIATSMDGYLFLCMGAQESVVRMWEHPAVVRIRARIDHLLQEEIKAQEKREGV